METENKKQLFFEEIPFVRAIACMLVVAVHTAGGNLISGSESYIALLLNQYGRLGTPIFAVISGFLLTSSVIVRGFSLQKFITSRTVKIISPYIIWTIAYILFAQYLQGRDMLNSKKKIFDYFVLGEAKTHLYFIVTVVQFYLIFPLLQLIRNRIVLLNIFVVASWLNFIWLKDWYPSLKPVFGSFSYILEDRSFLFNWISYFLTGMVLAYYWKTISHWAAKYKVAGYACLAIVIVVMYQEIDPGSLFSSSRTENLFYIPLLVFSLISIATSVMNYPRVYKWFRLIGDFSMGIYLIHPMFLTVMKARLSFLFSDIYGTVTAYVITLVLSTVAVKIISKIPKSTFIVPIPKPKK